MLGDPIVAARGRLEQHARGGLCVAAAAGKAQPNFVLAQVQLRLCFVFVFVCCSKACAVKDVWAQKQLAPQSTALTLTLRQHESFYAILGPAAAAAL